MGVLEILLSEARKALAWQRSDGSMSAGCNGPYDEPEFPIRNTAHWLIAYSACAQATGDQLFLAAAQRCAAYVKKHAFSQQGFSPLCRHSKHADKCNGLIGPAWVIEALSYHAKSAGDAEAREIAKRLFELHPFISDVGLWERVDIDGRLWPVDPAFNHQLWLAAAAAQLEDESIRWKLERFIDGLKDSLTVHPDGCIAHVIKLPDHFAHIAVGNPKPLSDKIYRRLVPRFLRPVRQPQLVGASQQDRDIGYHAFNLHAFAMLYPHLPDHSFWESSRFRAILDFAESASHMDGCENNPFAYPYNPVGVETAHALLCFRAQTKTECARKWWRRQVLHNLGAGQAPNNSWGANAHDTFTANARIYETVRLLPWDEDL